MKALGNSALGRAADLGPLLIRLGVGTVFAVHGWQKFDGGVSNFAAPEKRLSAQIPSRAN